MAHDSPHIFTDQSGRNQNSTLDVETKPTISQLMKNATATQEIQGLPLSGTQVIKNNNKKDATSKSS